MITQSLMPRMCNEMDTKSLIDVLFICVPFWGRDSLNIDVILAGWDLIKVSNRLSNTLKGGIRKFIAE